MAAKKILTPYNFTQNEIQNAVVQVLAAAPGTPLTGQIYYDSVTGAITWRTATAWVNPLARASHTGTQAWTTLTGTPTTLAGYAITDAAPLTHVEAGGTAHADVVAAGASGFMTGADKTKLNGIAAGATANSSDAVLLARANHTGTQTSATISDLATVVKAYRLDEFAAPITSLNAGSQKIINVGIPAASTDAANKQYVDDAVAGLSWKNEVRLASTANGALASAFANGSTVDAVLLVTGDRLLLKDQTAQAENGIYVVQAAGSPIRATDADSANEINGAAVFVTNGTANGGQRFVCNTSGAITLGTTAITFVNFGGGISYTNGNGLSLTGNTFAVVQDVGIIVTGAGVKVDTSIVARKVTGVIGDGVATSIAFIHGLANQFVLVQVFEVATLSMIECDVVLTNTTTATLIFAVAPTAGQYRVVIVG